MGARLAIPPQQHQLPIAVPVRIYIVRNVVERIRAGLKEWLAVVT